jgi:ATP-dependent Clp protease ATP-binding subunit ClpC
MTIELTPSAKELLAERGYDPVLGARPLRRAIQREIEDVLSEKILFGDIKPGQKVLVDAEGEGLLGMFTFTGVPAGEIVKPEPVAVGHGSTVEQRDMPTAPEGGGAGGGGQLQPGS